MTESAKHSKRSKREVVELKVTVECADEKQHLQISSLFKTIGQALDISIESHHALNDVKFSVANAHPNAVTEYVGGSQPHPLRNALGL